MASTAIPAAREAIVKALNEHEPLKGVFIADEETPERESEFISILMAESKREFKTLAGGMTQPPQEEQLKVWFDIVVYNNNGRNPKESEDRAVEIFEAVEDALRNDTDLGQAVLFQNINEMKIVRGGQDKKRGCMITAAISAKARI